MKPGSTIRISIGIVGRNQVHRNRRSRLLLFAKHLLVGWEYNTTMIGSILIHRNKGQDFMNNASMASRQKQIWGLAVALVSGAAVLLSNRAFGAEPPVDPSRAASTASDFQAVLIGRWVRADGGYVIDVRSASAGGKLDAGYYNPRPIKVARAEWTNKDGMLRVYIELRDINYPGSNYSLQYDPVGGRLAGNYYQAVQGTNFKVEFVRQ